MHLHHGILSARYRRQGRLGRWTFGILTTGLSATLLVAGVFSSGPARAATPATAAAVPTSTAKLADVKGAAAKSTDIAIDGIGESDGYHLRVARESSAYAWSDIAVIKPANLDESTWYGYQCLTDDGKYAAVSVLPADGEDIESQRTAGAYAYEVDIASGKVTALASGVGSFYFSPSCGAGDTATFTASIGADQQTTELSTYSLATGMQTKHSIVAGQITSAVVTGQMLVGARGNALVRIANGGTAKAPIAATTLTSAMNGAPYSLVPAADGGLDFLSHAASNDSAAVWHYSAGSLKKLGTGETSELRLFEGANGVNTATGTQTFTTNAHIKLVKLTHLGMAPTTVSLRRNAAFGSIRRSTPVKSSKASSPNLSTKNSDVAALELTATHKLFNSKFTTTPSTRSRSIRTTGPRGSAKSSDGDDISGVSPKESKTAATFKTGAASTAASITVGSTTDHSVTPALSPGATTPTCAVPRLSPTLQAMQPGNAQVSWAIEMAEQGLLTGSSSTRPANFDNMGLASYSPSSDFPPVPLSHPSSDTWNSVPRSVMEAIVAQESNFNQSSWHALPGIAGDPLIADYYGAGNSISTINYPAADCGYGLAQVTTGMHVGDTTITAHGQMKVAVDYQENVAAGLQILEKTWNQLYAAGITVNGGDPRYLENWYLAAWAYNTGIQPTAAFGNTTGCTPSASCTGPDGTWGLGWSNNPANPSYSPARLPYLEYTYGDAAHPSSWPYEERIMGWMGSAIVRYGFTAYTQADFHGGEGWLQIPPTTAFCSTAGDDCNPATSTCSLSDSECWWHTPVTWITSCSNTCATSSYTDAAGSSEPTYTPPATRPVTKTCTIDTSQVPAGSLITDDLATPADNLQGCSGSAWTNSGSFTLTSGQNSSGDPIGDIDLHQLGAGLGGHVYFTHTEPASSTSLIDKGVWAPSLPSTQNYKIMVHLPATGAVAVDATYTVNPGGGGQQTAVRLNQDFGQEVWVSLGTFGMQPGGTVTLTNASSMTAGAFDVAFDAIAFVPKGGTPNIPLGGPVKLQDAPAGSNPAWVNCLCGKRAAGDPVDTSTGYFGITSQDLATGGRGASLNLTLTYSSALADPSGPAGSSAISGAFGPGWTYSYGLSATTDPSTSAVTILQEDGSRVGFTLSGSTYTPTSPRFDATLTKSGTTYTYSRRGTFIALFDTSTGHLTAEYDQAGYAASPKYGEAFAYDASGHLHTVTDAGGRVYTFTWTGSHITSVVSSASQQVDYKYNASGQLTDIYGVGTLRPGGVDGDQDHSQYTYTAANLMSSFRTPNNYGKTGTPTPTTSMLYDSSERVTSQTDPMGKTTTFTYGPDTGAGLVAGQTLVTDAVGHKDLQTYTNGLLTSDTKGYGSAVAQTWTYAYDPQTLGVSQQTNPDGGVETFTYDDNGDQTSLSDALGRTTDFIYDANGHVAEETTPDLVQTTNTFNAAGAQTSETIAEPGQSAESSDSNPPATVSRTESVTYPSTTYPADPSVATDYDGNKTTLTFDAYGDMTSTKDAAGNTTKYGYDTTKGLLTATVSARGVAAGSTTSCAPPATGCTTYTHDAWGRVLITTDPLGHTTKLTYDADGDVLTSTDGDANTTTTTYDNDDRAVTVAAPTGTETTVYNDDGTSHSVTDLGAHATTYTYDGQGRVSTVTDPDSKVTQYGYDADGNQNSLIDPNGTTTSSVYDKAGELASVSYTGTLTAHSVSYTYDAAGRRATMTDATGTSTYSYDNFGELVSYVSGAGTAVGYTYDAEGNQTSIVYPGAGNTVTRGFNTLNQLANIKDAAGRQTTFTYDADGRNTLITYPNGTTDTIGYNNASQETSTALAKGATALGTFTYGRDNAGNESSSTPANGALGSATTYTYNANNELKTSVTGGTTTSHSYDNATNPTLNGATTQVFDSADRLCWATTTTVTSPSCSTPVSGATVYTTNADGQRTSKTPSGSTATNYAWNGAGELDNISGAVTASYVYNGDGLRTSKTVGSTTTSFTWSPAGTVPEMLTDGTLDYIYGPSGAPIEQTATAGASPDWYFNDAQGSTAELVDSTGAAVAHYSYSVAGAVTSNTGTTSTPLQFNGQYTDTESGLIYLRARYYDPATTLFLSVDPLVGATHAAFVYGMNNPLDVFDPLGLWGWGDTLAVVGIVGLVVAGVALTATGVGAIGDAGVAVGVAELGADIGADVAADAIGDAVGEGIAEEGIAADVDTIGTGARITQGAEKVTKITDVASKVIDGGNCAVKRTFEACSSIALDVIGGPLGSIGNALAGKLGRDGINLALGAIGLNNAVPDGVEGLKTVVCG
ncbi:RHS repeat-associated core domain-containing protein [Galbitalea soli]|uniref:Transglycosylase SLT domain-containing protein n=1 Tax=Galbitalea soli TaxID=1268042 RepID=A0A7C9PNE2_9MICO|nr:RHS repeat-associated core domain-containing protein [Galbitalea soli]NEM91391.1 transglycosylase SLT domain-containing protein [Galbitalea soli]NYJ30082.1 RHS repeat-associated protein [Galbitalea soli]